MSISRGGGGGRSGGGGGDKCDDISAAAKLSRCDRKPGGS